MMKGREAPALIQCGRRISSEEVEQIRETVEMFPGLSLKELLATICEHLGWYTAAGNLKREACRTAEEGFSTFIDHAAFGWDVRFRTGYGTGTVSKKQLGVYDHPIIWQEYEGLKKLLEEEDRFTQDWADRRQKFHWVNDIEYTYGANARNREIVHLVICKENWQDHYEPLTPCLAVQKTLKQGQRPPAVQPWCPASPKASRRESL